MFIDINKLPKKFNELNYFKKRENGCTLYSYSRKADLTIVCELADTEIEKDFCVDSKSLAMLLRLSPVKDIKVDKAFTIKSAKGNFKANLIEDMSFSEPKMDFPNEVKTDLDRLKIASTFVAKNDRKPVLCGVNVDTNGNLVATDSFIAYRHVEQPSEEKLQSIVIPSTFITFVCSIANENEVILKFNQNTCMVEIDGIKYVTRLIIGTSYPDTDRLFNNTINCRDLVFDNAALKEKLDIAKGIGETKNKENSQIFITFENGVLAAKGENNFSTDLKNENSGIEYKFSVSLANLLAIINNINDEKIVFEYLSELRPVFFNSNGNEFILLPVRMAE